MILVLRLRASAQTSNNSCCFDCATTTLASSPWDLGIRRPHQEDGMRPIDTHDCRRRRRATLCCFGQRAEFFCEKKKNFFLFCSLSFYISFSLFSISNETTQNRPRRSKQRALARRLRALLTLMKAARYARGGRERDRDKHAQQKK